jgi:hypothetical protein
MVSDRLIWFLLGYKNFLKINFKKNHGYPLNLDNPRSFFEKIQWIKVYGHLERFSKYVDKYAVREFVKERIGDEHLIPLIGCYDKVDDIDFNLLPDSFVMKATHGSSWNIIVKDKSQINWRSDKKKMNKWIRANYYYRHGEPNYKNLKGRILIEKYLDDQSGDLKDYKIYCSKGEPIYVLVDSDWSTNPSRDIYDMNWNKLPIKWAYENLPHPLARPKKLDEMMDICRKLSTNFAFVRVDLYYTGECIYFGELTFTPDDGMVPIFPSEYGYFFSELIDIKRYND